MRITLQAQGGLVYIRGLNRPVTVDSSDLSSDRAEELERLVSEARFFDLPPSMGTPAPGAADYKSYTLTVEDGAKRNAVSFDDTTGNATLRALRDFVRGAPG
jgi:hypothetical protein